ncbi:hypothetical protein PMAYCL1PPCAC_16646 [Pristionchus mayeri]|uniref:Uncharacterized protein n=1 Tax=Pristionchus mayeri TaxID=1317129 RepID=A0AAN5CL88_9BILA|nr:hypothetical protein PMAYCL1PPCAC_16646 [Pristionchus mayeri]
MAIRLEKCCCGLIKIETGSRIFAILAIISSLVLLGLAFFHKHLYRWEPYFMSLAGILQLVAAIFVLLACAKRRDDFMVPQLIVGFLVVVMVLIATGVVFYSQFDRDSKLQTFVRKAVTNMEIDARANRIHENNETVDSSEDEGTIALPKEEQMDVDKWTRIICLSTLLFSVLVLAYNIWYLATYWCAYTLFQDLREQKPMKTIQCKQVISERISDRFFPAI